MSVSPIIAPRATYRSCLVAFGKGGHGPRARSRRCLGIEASHAAAKPRQFSVRAATSSCHDSVDLLRLISGGVCWIFIVNPVSVACRLVRAERGSAGDCFRPALKLFYHTTQAFGANCSPNVIMSLSGNFNLCYFEFRLEMPWFPCYETNRPMLGPTDAAGVKELRAVCSSRTRGPFCLAKRLAFQQPPAAFRNAL